jgi:hypothetical protein
MENPVPLKACATERGSPQPQEIIDKIYPDM